ncbi:MAG: class I SAM-dependent methyltransferase [Chloroflexota bacterium]
MDVSNEQAGYTRQERIAENKTQRLQRWFRDRAGVGFESYGEYMHVGANQTLVMILIDDLTITPDMVVLDAGCGLGGNARWLASLYGCRVYGNDIDEDALQAATELAEIENLDDLCTFVNSPADKLDFEDGMFDIVVSTESPYDPSEIQRVLKPGGRFLLTTYVADPEDSPQDLAREYGMELELSHDVTRLAMAFHRAKHEEARLMVDAGMIQTKDLVELMNSTIQPYSEGGRHLLMRLHKR